ncbi:MAG TPA: hypothetical protein VFO86_10205, partial [Terriglobia bacterium]|nr:hypothetical protein [Terriglobia bacterium]
GIHFVGGADSDTIILAGGRVENVDRTGTLGGTVTFTITDTHSDNPEKVMLDGVETETNNLVEPSVFERIGSALGRFFRWLAFWVDDPNPAGGAETELALIGASLPKALGGGRQGEASAPISDKGGAEEANREEVTDGGVIDRHGFERLIEEGPNGFDLADIGSSIIDDNDLVARLDALDSVSGNVTSPAAHSFDVQIVKTLSGMADFNLLTTLFGGNIKLSGEISLSAEVVLHLQFGFDVDGIFIRAGPGNGLTIRHISLNSDIDISGQFGFLGVKIVNPTVTIDPSLEINFSLQDPSGGDTIRLNELLQSLLDPTHLSDLADFGITGSPADDLVFQAGIEVSALLPGQDNAFDLGGASFTATWADITQIQNVAITFNVGAAETLQKFLELSADKVLSKLKELRDSFTSLGVDVPFVSDTFDQVIAIADGINERFIKPLTNPLTGRSSFSTIQEMADQVSRGLNNDLDELGLNFDFSTRELTFHFDFAATYATSKSIDFSSILNLNVTADMVASAHLTGTLGLDLDNVLDGDFGNAIFLRNTTVGGTVVLNATDIDVTGTFGPFTVTVTDGTANISLALEVPLTDPNPLDGRLTLSELVGNLGTVF